MIRENIKYLAVLLVAYLLWNKMLKPLFLTWVKTAEEKRKRLELENKKDIEAREHNMNLPHREYDAKLAGARDLAKQDPQMIANVIKGWVGGQ